MEIIANAIQTVETNQNIYFTDTVVPGGCSIIHREDSGLVTLRGTSPSQCRARYKVTFNGNVAVPTGGTAGPIKLAIALEGEPILSTQMISTPGDTEDYNSVSSSTFIDVPKCCCYTISVQNTTATSIKVQNANLIVERVA